MMGKIFEEMVATLNRLGMKVFLIGYRALEIRGITINNETGDHDVFIDKPFTPEVRDEITSVFRGLGYNVKWRKWGMAIEYGDIHLNIHNTPLIFDDEFMGRCEYRDGVYIPSLEDLIILKLMSGKARDIKDIKKIFSIEGVRIDLKYLMNRARDAGLEKPLKKLLRRMGIDMGLSR